MLLVELPVGDIGRKSQLMLLLRRDTRASRAAVLQDTPIERQS